MSFLDRMAKPKRDPKVAYNDNIAQIRKRNISHKKKCKGKHQHDFSVHSPRKLEDKITESKENSQDTKSVEFSKEKTSSDDESSESSSCCHEEDKNSQEKDFDIDFSE